MLVKRQMKEDFIVCRLTIYCIFLLIRNGTFILCIYFCVSTPRIFAVQ